jgi:ornithine cyclodeaminase
MSRENSSIMAIIGAGHQSRFQIQAVSLVRKFKELRISDLDKARAENLAKWYAENIDGSVKIKTTQDAHQAAHGADVLTTITTSFKPVVSARSISPGTHINAMGSFTPDMHEIDCDIVQAAGKISTDVAGTTWQVAGDLVKPLEKGLIDKNAITAELGGIVSGKAKGRDSDEEITIFESVGFSVLDIAIAIGIYEAAKARKLGVDIEVFGNATGY